MLKTTLALILPTILTIGCAHKHAITGSQGADVIPEGIRVGIGSAEIKDGDSVDILKRTCKQKFNNTRGGITTSTCQLDKVGEALVLKVLDHDSAVIRPTTKNEITPDMIVEKTKK
jgi:hypothetical protein